MNLVTFLFFSFFLCIVCWKPGTLTAIKKKKKTASLTFLLLVKSLKVFCILCLPLNVLSFCYIMYPSRIVYNIRFTSCKTKESMSQPIGQLQVILY